MEGAPESAPELSSDVVTDTLQGVRDLLSGEGTRSKLEHTEPEIMDSPLHDVGLTATFALPEGNRAIVSHFDERSRSPYIAEIIFGEPDDASSTRYRVHTQPAPRIDVVESVNLKTLRRGSLSQGEAAELATKLRNLVIGLRDEGQL